MELQAASVKRGGREGECSGTGSSHGYRVTANTYHSATGHLQKTRNHNHDAIKRH